MAPLRLSALLLLSLTLLPFTPFVLLRAQTPLPPGDALINPTPLTAFRLNGPNSRATLVDISDAPRAAFTQAWRIETLADSSPQWAIEWRTPVTRAVARGDVGFLRFYARATTITDESGAAYLRLVVQKASPDYDKSLTVVHTVTREWREYLVPFAFNADYPERAAEVTFGFGFKRQSIELGGFDFLYYGKSVPLASLPRTRFSYAGREADAPWRAAALARIETLRKSPLTLQVVDASGQPVPNATVRVTQTRSAFHFGSALQFSRLVSDTPTNRIYRQKVLELFNAASPENDLKWPPWIGEWGNNYNRPQALAALAWLKQNRFHTRGHVLVWPGWRNLPNAISALRGTARQSEIPALVRAHIADVAGATRDLLDEWDVLNEPFANHDLMDLFGPAIQADWFNAARAAHPTAPLYLNDYSNHDASLDAAHVAHFESTARYLLEQRAPLGGLGLQAHISANPSPPSNVLAVLDRYAALNLPIRFTEFDINTDDEELQADYTRDFLIAAYSHASVVGVQLWGFWEGAHWIPPAAMHRLDWSEKPNARAYKSLVVDQWRTRANGATDAAGTFRTRGFHGDYTITVEHAGRTYEQTLTLRPSSTDTPIRIPLSAPRLSNLSTRAQAGTGDATLIPGFYVAGDSPKRILLRAIGPGLAAFGVANTLNRLELAVVDSTGTRLATNRGWDTASPAETAAMAEAATRTGAFALARNSADCALLLDLAPGAYTAPITSLDNTTGITLVELYALPDLPTPATPSTSPITPDRSPITRLANLSTRARVGPGEQLAIPGLVLSGPNARTLLVRAIGPGLSAFGVSTPLTRPALVLLENTTPLAANTSWETSADPGALTAASARAGAFPLRAGQPDSALLVTLPAGAYTLQVSDAANASGTVLIEIYDLSS